MCAGPICSKTAYRACPAPPNLYRHASPFSAYWNAPMTHVLHLGEGKTKTITDGQLRLIKLQCYGIDAAISERISNLFWMELAMHATDIVPRQVTDEVLFLEVKKESLGTKPAAPLTKHELNGLWHKHFYSAPFMVKNLLNDWSRKKGKQIIKDAFGAEAELSHKEFASRMLRRLD